MNDPKVHFLKKGPKNQGCSKFEENCPMSKHTVKSWIEGVLLFNFWNSEQKFREITFLRASIRIVLLFEAWFYSVRKQNITNHNSWPNPYIQHSETKTTAVEFEPTWNPLESKWIKIWIYYVRFTYVFSWILTKDSW